MILAINAPNAKYYPPKMLFVVMIHLNKVSSIQLDIVPDTAAIPNIYILIVSPFLQILHSPANDKTGMQEM